MTGNDAKALKRMLAQLDRRSRRRPWRFSFAPVSLVAALLVGQQLLSRLVPTVWEEFLPDGLDSAWRLDGVPGLVWRSAVVCDRFAPFVYAGIALMGLVAFSLCGRSWMMSWLVRLAAFGVVLVDAGIVIVTLSVSYRATVAGAGIPGL